MTGLAFIKDFRVLVMPVMLALVCSSAYGEIPENNVSVLVSEFNDPDQLSLPAANIVRSWLEQEFRRTGYIDVDILSNPVPYGGNGFIQAVESARAEGGDIVLLGSCLDEGDLISVAVTSVVSTDCPDDYSRMDMFFEGENSLTAFEMTLGSAAPDRFRFYANLILADWMLKMDRLEEADEFLGQALLYTEDAPTEQLYVAFCVHGDMKQTFGFDHEAIQIYSSALAIFPDDVFLLRSRAASYDAAGLLNDAVNDLFHAFELEPDNPALNAQLGAQLKQAERYAESLVYLQRSMEQDSFNAMSFRDYSRAHYGLGNYELALEAVDCAIIMDPENPQGHSMRGFILYEMNSPAAAMESFGAAIERETDPAVLPWIVIGRGICLVALGDYELALEDLNTTLEYSPSFYVAYYYMGIANMELGNTDSAGEYLTEFLSHPLIFSPVDPWTKEGLHEEAEELLRNM
ncbi:MAG: tetratricopeptide repeat protein [Candidatus Sabulitectum sp.]|nr:tetratricopeptide repeat protein [Candidatus Sabulitectum sp.]